LARASRKRPLIRDRLHFYGWLKGRRNRQRLGSVEEFGRTPTLNGYPMVLPVDSRIHPTDWMVTKPVAAGRVDGSPRPPRQRNGAGSYTAQITRQLLLSKAPRPERRCRGKGSKQACRRAPTRASLRTSVQVSRTQSSTRASRMQRKRIGHSSSAALERDSRYLGSGVRHDDTDHVMKTLARSRGAAVPRQRSARLAGRASSSGRCSMSMLTSWTSAPLSRGELSGCIGRSRGRLCGLL